MRRSLVVLSVAGLLLLLLFSASADDLFTADNGYVYTVNEDQTATIMGYTGEETDLVIPEVLDSFPVTVLGKSAFAQNKSIVSVVVPGTIKKVCLGAFSFCDKLVSVEMLEGVEELDNRAFWFCPVLEKVILPESIRLSGYGIFVGCDRLSTVSISPDHQYFRLIDDVLYSIPDSRLLWYPATNKQKQYNVPDGTRIIASDAFADSLVEEVHIPESVVEIGSHAFYTCTKLKKLNIPTGVPSIDGVFQSCGMIPEVEIPDNHPVFQSIDGVVFSRDNQVLLLYPTKRKGKQYEVPDGTSEIGARAFEYCELVSVEIPVSVKSIGTEAFKAADKLKKVILHNGLESMGGAAFSSCKLLSEITLPATLVHVADNPFLYCNKLKVSVEDGNPSLAVIDGALINKATKTFLFYPASSKAKSFTVPEGCEYIDTSAFTDATMSELVFPEGTVQIRKLNYCKNLRKILLPSTLQQCDIHDSYGIDLSKIVFKVKEGSYAEQYCKSFDLKVEY